MLIRSIVLTAGYPIGRENPKPAPSCLTWHYPEHARHAIL